MRISAEFTSLVLVFALLPVPCSSAASRAEIVRESGIGTVHQGIYRAAVCPNGTVFVTNSEGEIAVLDGEGSLVASKTGVEEVREATASTCDNSNRVYVAADGWVRIYEVSSAGEVLLQRSFWIAGGPTRLLVTPSEELYVLGPAKVADQHVLLRRFQLPDGGFLGVVPIDLPLQTGRTFNQLAYRGMLFWHAGREQAVYLPANPLKLWCIDELGRVDQVLTPDAAGFDTAELPDAGAALIPVWQAYDQVFNATVLPNGQTYLQVLKARGPSGPEAGKSYMHLRSLDANLASSAEIIPADELNGLMIGADGTGSLYFIRFPIGSEGSVMKVQIVDEVG